MTEKHHFLYQFILGDRAELATNPDAWTEEENQISADHYAYLKQALEDGVLIFAGRSLDGIGPAVVVIEAETEDAARAFLREDPFVKSELFGADLHPFRAALVRVPQK
jgi:uncharacterized protein YciI